MWFRLSGGSQNSGGTANTDNCDLCNGRGSIEGDTVIPCNNPAHNDMSKLCSGDTTVTTNGNESLSEGNKKMPREASKFEKFRRASFRRKSSTAGNAGSNVRKRSKSPHAILRSEKSFSSVEEETNEENSLELKGKEDDKKKVILKPIKTDPPKRKFYKFASMRRQNSDEKQSKITAEKSDVIDGDLLQKSTTLSKYFPKVDNNNKKVILNAISDDDDDDDDDDDEDDEGNMVLNVETEENGMDVKRKEKILLTDPKFKHNRIEKSSSKTKVNHTNNISGVAGDKLEKRESIKRSRSGRKISAPPILVEDKKSGKKCDKEARSRTQASSLNLQALVKFVINNKKFLSADDFKQIRRKSISEAASTMIAVASCKPLPIALKYPAENIVAEAPKENDTKTDKNVVLVKKQSLSNSFCDNINNNDSEIIVTKPPTTRVRKSCDKEVLKKGNLYAKAEELNAKVKRNSSNSSKSSGNFEDEAFYSCDELEAERLKNGVLDEELQLRKNEEKIRKISSPSITSRVAAKFNETTNIYKNRRAAKSAKKRKGQTNGGEKRPELYKQISVERLHSTSIVRQPSDRRPDASALRANNNASIGTHNNELQSSFHESKDMGTSLDSSFAAGGGGGGSGGGPGMGSVDGDGVLGPDGNMQDTDGKDARRERLQQQHLQNKSAPVSVNRSESYKERLSNKRNRSRRKTSDPSLTSRPNDDQSDLGLSNSNYTASSNSSLSSGGGSESPSTSMEQVANATTNVQHQQHHHHHPQHAHSSSMHGHHGVHHAHQHSHQDSFHSSSGGSTSFWGGSIGSANANHLTRQWNFDTDEEDDLLNEADWSSLVASDILAALTDAEKKRQEIINEIYQTERNHVRTLKLLERLFFLPLQESGVIAFDHLLLLFPPALGTLRDLHGTFEQKLKQRRMDDNHVVGEVGDLLAQMFDGQSGEELREYAAQFCARQQIALEALKEKRRKDEQLQKLLTKAESHKACRRLQLKDLLPTVLQRLTKYPLLFENLYKVTVRVMPENTIEAEAIQRSLESSKKILVDVNQAVKTAEDAHKLQNIQRKLDKSTFDKDEFKNLDLTQYRLIFDGNLTLKKSPTTQLHSLLFEDMIVLLTKQDDKYSLKYLQQHSTGRNNEVNNKPVSPIMSIVDTIARQDATDKNTFFLIKTKSTQMLELRAASSSESKTWFKHITDAAEQYKRSKHATTETVDDPAIVTIPHSNKDSLELTSERPAHLAATATMTITPLAPMLPPPTATAVATTYITPNNNNIGSNDSIAGVQLRHHNRRESTPTHTVSTPPTPQTHTHAQQQQQQQLQTGKNARHSHNELTPSTLSVNSTHSGDSLSPMVNRTMSTRSCGETPTSSQTAGVTLRHTQSARQANAQDLTELECSRRDSNSIVYAHNPNNTLTLLQTAPPLIDPSAVQISITPVHICETPVEKLRRVDGNVREGLLEKQRIICDLFRLPVEHFHEIVDIAAMPEAPKDSADIALAAYAQVQNLTEVLNEYLQISAAQENAVNNLGCDQCFDKQKPLSTNNSNSSNSSSSSITPVTVSEKPSPLHGIPPPLPPPNKQQPAGQTATPNNMPKLLTPIGMEQGAHIHEDDDGYCEIDELRLPALPHNLSNTNKDKVKEVSNAPPLPPPAGSFKAPPPPPPPPPPPSANVSPAKKEKREAAKEPTSELTKRQSTISADSIPEESAEDITRALAEDNENQTKDLAENKIDQTEGSVKTEICEKEEEEAQEKSVLDNKNVMSTKFEPSSDEKKILKDADTQTKLSLSPNNVVNTNTTTIITIGTNNNNNNNNNSNSNNNTATYENCQQNTKTLNGPIRIQHAHNLEPSVPCHALSSIVCALNTHISLLLPTINERDIERERLRKENQQLRDLLNTMQQERTRVDANMETPSDITLGNTAATSANDDCRKMAAEDECDGTAVTSNSNNTQNNNNNNKLNGQTTTEITITEPVDEDKLANATTLVTISNENLKENITTESVTNETD